MAFDPVVTRQWTARVLHDMDSSSRSPKPARLEMIGPALPDVPETGLVVVGYDPAGSYGEKFFLFWDDSASHASAG